MQANQTLLPLQGEGRDGDGSQQPRLYNIHDLHDIHGLHDSHGVTASPVTALRAYEHGVQSDDGAFKSMPGCKLLPLIASGTPSSRTRRTCKALSSSVSIIPTRRTG